MYKIRSNIPEVTIELNKLDHLPRKILIGAKTYKITKQKAIQREPGEIIGRRLLGGFLVCISLGFLYFYNRSVKELFQKTKYISVKATLYKTSTAESTKKTARLSTLIETPSNDVHDPEFVLEKETTEEEQPISDAQIARLLTPRTTSINQAEEDQSSPYLTLPKDIRKEVESYLSLEEFILASRISKGIKRSVEESLTTDIRQIEIFVKLWAKDPVIFHNYNHVIKNSPSKGLLQKLLEIRANSSQLNEEFLKALEPNVRKSFLKAIIEMGSDQTSNQALYKKFASYETQFALVSQLAEEPITVINEKLYENWAVELRKGVNFQNKKEKDAFYKLLCRLIIPNYLIELSNCDFMTDSAAYPLIEKEMPDLTIFELSMYTMKQTYYPMLDVAPSLAAYRALKLCTVLDGKELRKEFNALYLESLKASFAGIKESHSDGWIDNWDIENSKKVFSDRLHNLLLDEIEFPKDTIRKLMYALNGLVKASSLRSVFMKELKYWGESHQEELLIALEEFARSHLDTFSLPDFTEPFSFIVNVDEVSALIRGVKDFETQARSLYLRAIAFGIYLDTEITSLNKLLPLQIRDAFKKNHVEFPKGGIVYELEVIQYASAVTPFIKSVNAIKNRADFEAVVKDTLLPSVPSELQEGRLWVLAYGTEFLDFKSKFEKYNTSKLTLEQLTPLNSSEWESLSPEFRSDLMQITSESQLEHLSKQHRTNLLELRAIANHVYRLFQNSLVSPEERSSIFSANDLKIELFQNLDLNKWLKAEGNHLYAENTDLKYVKK